MSLGGDVSDWLVANPNLGKTVTLDLLDHSGVKGMRWGVRNAVSAVGDRHQENKEDRQKFRVAARMTAGEVVVSGMLLGPVGVIGYAGIKHHAAAVKRRNSNLSGEDQTALAGKVRLGEGLAVAILTTPVGFLAYAAAKGAAARTVKDF